MSVGSGFSKSNKRAQDQIDQHNVESRREERRAGEEKRGEEQRGEERLVQIISLKVSMCDTERFESI